MKKFDFVTKIDNIFKSKNGILLFFLFFIFVNGIVWSLSVSLFTLSDEVTHFTYIHYIAEYKELPRSEDALAKLEASSVELRNILKKLEIDKTPLSAAHMDFAGTASDIKSESVIPFDEFLNNPNLRANWSFNYPPLYYSFASIIYAFGKAFNFDIISIAYLIRFSSIFFLIITLVFSYKIALIASKDDLFAITVCAIIGLLTSVNTVFSSINNDVALIAFSHIAFYYILKIFNSGNRLSGLSILAASLGVLAAMLSKPQAIIFIPLLAGAIIYSEFKGKKIKRGTILSFLISGTALLTAIFFVFPSGFINFLKIPFKSINGSGEIVLTLINDAVRRFNLMFDFFTQLGIYGSDYPIWIFSILGVLILFSIAGIALFFYKKFKYKSIDTAQLYSILAVMAPIIILEILYTFLYYREAIINEVYDFPGQGRYYFLVLAPLIIVFLFGLRHMLDLIKLPLKAMYFFLILFFAFLNCYFLLNIVLKHSYL